MDSKGEKERWKEPEDLRTKGKISYELFEELKGDPEKCIRYVRILYDGQVALWKLKEKILSFKINQYLRSLVARFRWDLSETLIFKSDYSWMYLDEDLSEVIKKIDACKTNLVSKEHFSVEDLYNTIKALDEINCAVAQKKEQIQSLYQSLK